MRVRPTKWGYEIKTSHVTVLFGGVDAQKDSLQDVYPDFDFVRVKQIHGDALVESKDPQNDYQIVADAHFTTQVDQALCIITADCIPLFFYDHSTGIIAGVHAGWRGVANSLSVKTVQRMKELGALPEKIQVFIGPHIQKASFEVGFDVRDQILASIHHTAVGDKDLFFEKLSEEKSLVDLNEVIRHQLHGIGIHQENIFNLSIDTVTSADFHSYRRDQAKSGRQLSFICRHSST